MEQQLSTSLSDGRITEFVENDEVDAGEIVGDATLAPGARFRFQPVDEIDGVEEPPRRPARMQLRAMARCVLPVAVPPTRTRLRCCSTKPPPARSRTRVSLTVTR